MYLAHVKGNLLATMQPQASNYAAQRKCAEVSSSLAPIHVNIFVAAVCSCQAVWYS